MANEGEFPKQTNDIFYASEANTFHNDTTANNAKISYTDASDVSSNTSFRTTPSTVITAGSNLSWDGNTLNATGSGGGTSYWSCSGVAFIDEDVDEVNSYDASNGVMKRMSGEVAASVTLPHGATVTGCVVYCDTSTDTWWLYRAEINSNTAGTIMATANNNTEDTSISNSVVDNQTYKYWIRGEYTDQDDYRGARITYTL